ncbi:replication initiation and membrane attachment family protein [Bacillus sp. FJAT-49736]|uniref:replication initiation and membrane attachment family protein n=1 Tax=Bacillus sp. FJAT-49736 TaxID=2833582 RepID=UPI001BC972B6|nr:replication initiation and membrane attachment family protein [Bacillus sp. FJAT-49736]MBS4173781.1 replication initiation and membrane attachment family protein [Bacillus sp. FJAT-49736]
MKQLWNEIQPVDRYFVTSNGILHEYDRKVISLLYQPLIGVHCFSLYTTLWNEMNENQLWSDEWTHYHLMNFLSLNLRDIYEARLKLEGIGLLKTYVKNENDDRIFIYELQPPLSPAQFFTDGILNVFLYKQLGKQHFLRLKKLFTDNAIEKEEFQEVTRSFQDVFLSSSGEYSLLDYEALEASKVEEQMQFHHRNTAEEIKIVEADFDFELFLSGLKGFIHPQKEITAQVKEAIYKLAFLYQINAIEMQNIFLSALNAEQSIDIEALRKASRDWYQLEHGNDLPKLMDRLQPLKDRTSIGNGDSREDKLIHYLETTSPRQLLIDISDGVSPSKGDLQAIEEIMFQQKLSPGVVNVLIQYVLLKTDMKLTKNYMEKIASHWARKKVKTVKEAMELAKNEHRQYQQWADNKDKPKNTKKNPIRTEKLPDWFTEKDETQSNPNTGSPSAETLEEKRKRLESIQKKYKK